MPIPCTTRPEQVHKDPATYKTVPGSKKIYM